MITRTPTDRRLRAQAQPAASAEDSVLIRAFLERIWAEQGLAQQTLDSYRRDLDGFARWLRPRAIPLLAVQRLHLFDYLAERSAGNYASRSNARLLSSLRSFYSQQL
ncbi:MAG: site-specific integrase, partial [Arenimonas sp.]